MSPRQRAYYRGIALAPYDLVKEGLIAIVRRRRAWWWAWPPRSRRPTNRR